MNLRNIVPIKKAEHCWRYIWPLLFDIFSKILLEKIRWEVVCLPKAKGGLGLRRLA